MNKESVKQIGFKISSRPEQANTQAQNSKVVFLEGEECSPRGMEPQSFSMPDFHKLRDSDFGSPSMRKVKPRQMENPEVIKEMEAVFENSAFLSGMSERRRDLKTPEVTEISKHIQ